MVLPSLILRLEHLALPEASRLPVAERDPATVGAPRGELAIEPVATELVSTEALATEPLVTASATMARPVIDTAPNHYEPATSEAEVRRVVDVAAPERLSTATPLSRWSAAVAAAHDACFVLDLHGIVISVSVAAVDLLGCADVPTIGRHVLDVLNLVDLETGAAHPEYAPRITPLAVLDGPGLGRSLMRVRHSNGAIVTLDTSSAPIHDVNAHLLGSMTFIAPIPAR